MKMKKSVLELKPHPINEQIYVEDNIDDLMESIKQSGKVTTITVNTNDTIVSGHRRWRCCKELSAQGDTRFNFVNCEIMEFENEYDELEYLIISNDTRKKTKEQIGREAAKMFEVEQARAEKRRLVTQNNKKAKGIAEVAELPPLVNQGKTRDIVAKKLHMKSGREVERTIKTINKIDELTGKGRKTDAVLLREILNKGSASTAEMLVGKIDILSEQDKEDILNKKKSTYSVLEKCKETSTPAPKPTPEKETERVRTTEEVCRDLKDVDKERPYTPEMALGTFTGAVNSFISAVDFIMTFKDAFTGLDSEIIEEYKSQENKIQGIIKLLNNKLTEEKKNV